MLLSQNDIASPPCAVGNVPRWPFKVELLRKFFNSIDKQACLQLEVWTRQQWHFSPENNFCSQFPACCMTADETDSLQKAWEHRAVLSAICKFLFFFFLHPYCEIQSAVPTAFSWNQPSRLLTFVLWKFPWLSVQKPLSFNKLIHECNQRHSKKYLRCYF